MKIAITLLFVFASFGISLAQQQIVEDPKKGEVVYYCGPCGCADDDKYFSKSGQCQACSMSLMPTILGLEVARPSIERPTVGMFLFNMADIMDVSGPISVFEHAGFNIVTFSKTSDPVLIGMNLELRPDYTIESLPQVDILVLPGGGMAESNPGDEEVTRFLHGRKDSTEVLLSVCSGAFFLGEAGLLDGLRSTTFAGLIPRLKEQYPRTVVLNDVKYTDNGQVVTSAGLSSGIDAAFHVVSKFYGVGRAQDIANHMEYPWKRENDYARSQLADNYITDLRALVSLFSTSYFYSQGDQNTWEYRFHLTNQIPPKQMMKLIKKEIEKNSDWITSASKPLSTTGIVDHEVLGKGKVNFSITIDSESIPIAIIKASRLQMQLF
ncbi:MAG: DJ-1/PfpI family protein [Reichenbachiella sp.]|uniref:DJ-1/PfpI family protein n=1 Tax=Reichenbachiella sp. TaxID=2184521 RepID=UPI0032633229